MIGLFSVIFDENVYFIAMFLIPLILGFVVITALVPYFVKKGAVRGRGWIYKKEMPKTYWFGLILYVLLGLYLMAMSYPIYLIGLEG